MVAQCNLTLIHAGELAVSTEEPLIGTWTFHELGLLLSLVFGGIAVAISLVLIALHAMHYSKPNEQRHIIRIIFMIPVYATISLISYKFYRYALYWEVLRDCYEAFAISSFFHLLCYYIAPTLHDQKNFFRSVTPKNWVWPMGWVQCCTGGKDKGLLRRPRSGLTWFNIIWISIFQYCVVRVIMTFAAMITQLLEIYCESSLYPSYAHVWVMSINALSVTVAMYCLIQFYVQLREDLAAHRPFLKVLCIKLVIFFSFWQVLLISFLSSGTSPVITTGPRVSYIDVKVGIPCVLLTFEMAIFAIMHIFAFPWRPYVVTDHSDPDLYYQGGFLGLKAYIDCFNPWDIIKASARGFRWLFVGARKRHEDPSYKLETTNYDPRGQDDALPAHKLHMSDDSYNNSNAAAMHPSTFNTAASTRPTTTEADYNDRAALLRHQDDANSNFQQPSSNIGVAAPYPHTSNETAPAAVGAYGPVATHSPPMRQGTIPPYPTASAPYPVAMPSGMPSAITTDIRHENAASSSPHSPQPPSQQGQWQNTTYSPQRDDGWNHAR